MDARKEEITCEIWIDELVSMACGGGISIKDDRIRGLMPCDIGRLPFPNGRVELSSFVTVSHILSSVITLSLWMMSHTNRLGMRSHGHFSITFRELNA